MNKTPSLPALVVQPTRVRWLIFVLACITSFLLYLHRYSWGVIKVRLAKQDLVSVEESGWLDAVFSLTYASGQVPIGLASDLVGPRLLLSLSVVLWTSMLVMIALVASFSLWATALGLFGIGQAGTYPILGKLTREWFPLRVRTSVQGTITAMGRVGGGAASILLLTILMTRLGFTWRHALLLIAMPGLLLAAVLWVVVRGRPEEHPGVNAAEQHLIEAGSPLRGPAGAVPFRPRREGMATFVMLLVYSFVSTFADQLYPNWIPLYLDRGRGLTEVEVGLFTPLPLLGGALGGIAGGLLNDALLRWTGNRRWARSGVAFTGKSLAAVLLVLSLLVPDGRWAMVVLLFCKFFADWSQPSQWGTATDIGGRASATVFAFANTAGNLGGVVAGPVLGRLAKYNWEVMFLCVAGVYVAAAVSWLFIDCTRKLID